MKKHFSLFVTAALLLISGFGLSADKEYTVKSPNGKLIITITTGNGIKYSIKYDNTVIIEPSGISMKVNDNVIPGKDAEAVKVETKEVNQLLKPVIKVKSAVIPDHYNEMKMDFTGCTVVFRAYDDGAAYRFLTDFKDSIKVNTEDIAFNFADNYNIYFPEEESFLTHMERIYSYQKLSDIDSGRFSSIPALIDCGKIKIALTEADLFDYPGFYLTHTDKPKNLKAIFPGYPLEEHAANDRDIAVTKYADYIARTAGAREFPWRVFIITENDKDLITSQMIYKLASPEKFSDTQWIKPGKVAWDWWNNWNIYNVDFRAGINTETYKYYIDFASDHNLQYVILDEGWYQTGDLMKLNPQIDLHAILDYAKKKDVGIILWAIWKTLDNQFDEAMNMFSELGVKGIKVDFMQRDDQPVVQFYEKTAKAAAERKMLVDFHGAYKPTGLIRTYPNVITSEGVRGNEWNKWSEFISPEHTMTIPFIRMLAGPMDFTPGAMLNGNKGEFNVVFSRPMSQGTRCRQLAMYVVYESPLQMLCDNPTNYIKEPECLDFLTKVPTVWDTTIVLDAKVADYVLIARRNGNEWYAGAMTDSAERNLEIDFSFLGSGNYKIDYYQDGINADRIGIDYKKITADITSKDKIKIHMTPGGGWAARIYKQ